MDLLGERREVKWGRRDCWLRMSGQGGGCELWRPLWWMSIGKVLKYLELLGIDISGGVGKSRRRLIGLKQVLPKYLHLEYQYLPIRQIRTKSFTFYI